MHLHKEGFDASVERKIENITSKSELIPPNFLNNLSELRESPPVKLWKRHKYKTLVSYLKDVSTTLDIISVV